MTAQNLHWFTETDPNGRMTVTQTSVSASNLIAAEAVSLVRDLHARRLGDFTHTLTLTWGETGQAGARVGIWAVSNTQDTIYNWVGDGDQSVYLRLDDDGANMQLTLAESESGDSDSVTWAQSVGGTYYLTITRSGATVTCTLHSDAARTAVVDSLSISVPIARQWRYLYQVVGYGGSILKILPNLVLADLEASAMADCVLESIMQDIKTTLDALVTSGDLANVERPVRGALPTRPQHTGAVLYQDDPIEGESAHGAKAWQLPVAIDLFIRPADSATEAVDTTINNLRATVEAALTADVTAGGYAHDLRIRPPLSFTIGDQFEGIRINAEVFFSTDESDPFTQR